MAAMLAVLTLAGCADPAEEFVAEPDEIGRLDDAQRSGVLRGVASGRVQRDAPDAARGVPALSHAERMGNEMAGALGARRVLPNPVLRCSGPARVPDGRTPGKLRGRSGLSRQGWRFRDWSRGCCSCSQVHGQRHGVCREELRGLHRAARPELAGRASAQMKPARYLATRTLAPNCALHCDDGTSGTYGSAALTPPVSRSLRAAPT